MHCQHTTLVVSAGHPNTQLPAIPSADTPRLSFDHPNHPLKRMSAPVLNRAKPTTQAASDGGIHKDRNTLTPETRNSPEPGTTPLGRGRERVHLFPQAGR